MGDTRMRKRNPDFLRGTVDVLLLKALSTGPRHGFAMFFPGVLFQNPAQAERLKCQRLSASSPPAFLAAPERFGPDDSESGTLHVSLHVRVHQFGEIQRPFTANR